MNKNVLKYFLCLVVFCFWSVAYTGWTTRICWFLLQNTPMIDIKQTSWSSKHVWPWQECFRTWLKTKLYHDRHAGVWLYVGYTRVPVHFIRTLSASTPAWSCFCSVPKSTGKSSFPEAQSGFINENHNLNYDNFLIYVLTTFLFAEK